MLRLEAQIASTNNIVLERNKFRKRKQLPRQAVDVFIPALWDTSSGWNIDQGTNDPMRDQLVPHTSIQPLRERLLLEACSLNLNPTPVIARNMEQATRYAKNIFFYAGKKGGDGPCCGSVKVKNAASLQRRRS